MPAEPMTAARLEEIRQRLRDHGDKFGTRTKADIAALLAEVERLRTALLELAETDGSSANVANADVLATRVRRAAKDALSGADVRPSLRKALEDLVRAFVNPGDGDVYEAGEVPELDAARAALGEDSSHGG